MAGSPAVTMTGVVVSTLASILSLGLSLPSDSASTHAMIIAAAATAIIAAALLFLGSFSPALRFSLVLRRCFSSALRTRSCSFAASSASLRSTSAASASSLSCRSSSFFCLSISAFFCLSSLAVMLALFEAERSDGTPSPSLITAY